MPRRFSESPDLVYLVRDFDAVYRLGSAGGSKVIRSHQRKVREAISDLVEADPEVVDREPHPLPVCRHLPRALDLGTRGVMAQMANSLDRIADGLTWEYGYAKVPRGLTEKYGYCEIVGPRGPVVCDDLVLGLVLFAPRTTYPQHHHADIEESYIAVSGAWSENDTAVYAPGSLILNVPGHDHRITTGFAEPTLLAYAWIGPVDRLREPGMRFGARRDPR